MIHILSRIVFLLLLCTNAAPLFAQLRLDLEGGVVFGTNYNKVRIPNAGGTLVNLVQELEISPKAFYRIRGGYTFAKRHNISALYAPLTVHYNGRFREDVNFNGILFPIGQHTTVFYKFNSYRLTYRYDFISKTRWTLGAGLTAKIRDADVRFKNESNDTHFDNIGFVPLINFTRPISPLIAGILFSKAMRLPPRRVGQRIFLPELLIRLIPGSVSSWATAW